MKRSIKILKEQCSDWNMRNPIGTIVNFHPVIGRPEFRVRKTRSEAWVLSGHTIVVQLEGESGCVAVEACGIYAGERLL
jgi:hypothetical protein